MRKTVDLNHLKVSMKNGGRAEKQSYNFQRVVNHHMNLHTRCIMYLKPGRTLINRRSLGKLKVVMSLKWIQA